MTRTTRISWVTDGTTTGLMPRLREGNAPDARAALVATMLGLLLVVAGPLRAQLIDRVLAVVVGEPITLSDVTAAIRLGLVPAPAGSEDRVQVVLTALIERQLELVEVNRYVPPEPSAAQIEAGLTEVRARFDSQAALAAAMRETGVSEAQLRARIRDDVRLETYLKQRFGGSYQPGEEEVARYYRSHESDFIRNGVLRPYEDVRDEARQRLLDERAATLIRDWIAGLRRRTDVTILPK